MTQDEKQEKKTTCTDTVGLGIVQSLSDNAFTLRLGGRLDSISAPEFLGMFKTITNENTVQDIILDLENLEYTSSAGLRVMLIMYKHAGEGHFRFLHVSDAVGAVSDSTGFSDIFLTEHKKAAVRPVGLH